MTIKQQKHRRQNQTHRHEDSICEGISGRWEDGKITIKFVKSEDNEAEEFKKNTSSITYQRHKEKLVWDKKEVTEDK